MQLAKFSEDTLSSYTEAVSSQVHTPGTPSSPGPCSTNPSSLKGAPPEPWDSPTLWPWRLLSHVGSALCPDKCLSTAASWCPWTASSARPRGYLWGNNTDFVSPTRKCYVAFGVTS